MPPANSWTIAAGVWLHGLTWARPLASSPTASTAQKASNVNAMPLDAVDDRPLAVSTAVSTAATHSPTASISKIAAASTKVAGAPLAVGRIPMIAASSPTVSLMHVRALLIINPRATSANGRVIRLVTRDLAAELDVEACYTRYRSHASELASAAADDGVDLVLTFGGDGTVNETVNGLMASRAAAGGHAARGGHPAEGHPGGGEAVAARVRTAFAPIPGGGANVFARSLGLPTDPVAAVRHVAGRLTANGGRTIGLGMAGDRYFTFSAGLGLDAEVVAEVERLRATGKQATPALWTWTTVRRYYLATDRRQPALTLQTEGGQPVPGLFMGVVTNSSPWTYLGNRAVSPVPTADFNHGLDVFALRRLRTITTLSAVQQMLHTRSRPPHGRDVFSIADQRELVFRASRPIAFHVDGEYIGETETMEFHYVPDAIKIIALLCLGSVTDLTPRFRGLFAVAPCAPRPRLRGWTTDARTGVDNSGIKQDRE